MTGEYFLTSWSQERCERKMQAARIFFRRRGMLRRIGCPLFMSRDCCLNEKALRVLMSPPTKRLGWYAVEPARTILRELLRPLNFATVDDIGRASIETRCRTVHPWENYGGNPEGRHTDADEQDHGVTTWRLMCAIPPCTSHCHLSGCRNSLTLLCRRIMCTSIALLNVSPPPSQIMRKVPVLG